METTHTDLISSYVTPPEIIDEMKPIRVVVLNGITGAGKDTIIGDILGMSPDFVRVVTSTTRQKRENNGVMEREGVEYYFLTEEQALQNIADGEYIEVAPVHGRINGSLISEYRRIAALDKVALTDINYEGVENFLSFGMQNLSVYFVIPPSFEIWLARLMKRQAGAMEDRDELLRRFRSAQAELANALDHPSFIPIMNDVSRDTAQKIIDYVASGVGPSDQERARAREATVALTQAINNYIEQLEPRL